MSALSDQNDTLAQLTALLRTATQNLNPPGPLAWPQSPPAFAPANFGPPVQPCGLLVAVTVPTAQGDVPGYLQLPAQALQNPAAAIAQLQAQGWPLRTYQRRDAGNGFQGRRWGRRW